MRIELLTTGTELLLGTTQNTHGAWIGQRLFSLGLRVSRQVTVPDGQAVIEAMHDGVEYAEVLLVTGGLGPTSDDLTREALAEVLGLEMLEDEQALRTIEEFFASRGREMVEANRKQAMAPVGADILANPNGTAPGLYVPPRLSGERNCAVFLLPGPPREMCPMFEEEVVPRLEALAGISNPPEMLELRFVGIGESDFHQGIDDELEEVRGLEHGYCARLGEVDLRLIGTAEVIAAGRKIAERVFARELVSDDGASLEEVVVRLLKKQGKTVATAESCTGGLVASRITDVSGASEVFRYGFVTYANEAKRDLLAVGWDDLLEHGAVSEPVARQMAEGALRVGEADLAVAVTGIAGPTGGSDEKPVGTVFLALAVKDGKTRALKQFHPRDRDAFKRAVSQAALNLVRRVLVGKVVQASSLREDTVHSSGLVFRPYNPDRETKKNRRRLPHWEQAGVTQYVTFRLIDSIPPSALESWERKRLEWLELRGVHAEKGKSISLDSLPADHRREYLQRFGTWFQDQLDQCHGECVLRSPENRKVVEEALKFFDGERYDLGDFVIMPNHVHVLLVPREGHSLSSIVKSWKQHTAWIINKQSGRSGTLWQGERFDYIVRSTKQLERICEYIRENPERAKLKSDEYTYRSSDWQHEAETDGS